MSKTNTKEVITSEERARLDATKLFLIIFACVALVGIIAAIIIGAVAGANKNLNYMKANLSKYVYVSKDLYNSYDVTINLPAVNDRDLEDALIKILPVCKKSWTIGTRSCTFWSRNSPVLTPWKPCWTPSVRPRPWLSLVPMKRCGLTFLPPPRISVISMFSPVCAGTWAF